jgi:hypothetical protein
MNDQMQIENPFESGSESGYKAGTCSSTFRPRMNAMTAEDLIEISSFHEQIINRSKSNDIRSLMNAISQSELDDITTSTEANTIRPRMDAITASDLDAIANFIKTN